MRNRKRAVDVRLRFRTISRVMVLGYHLIFTAYGWWLPNDPRGSLSKTIHSDVIAELGELHYGRKRVQPASSTIRQFYNEATSALRHPLLAFDEDDREQLALSFAETVRRWNYTCYALAIMKDHIHGCLRKHRHTAEQMLENLQRDSQSHLISTGRRFESHPVWGGPGWKVFLESPDDFRRTIQYIEDNPIKAHWPAQQFPFVTPYDGWPKSFRSPRS